MRRAFFFIIFIVGSLSAFAQNQRQTSEYISIRMHDLLPDYGGTFTYSYILDDSGNRIKNGPLTISGSRDDVYEFLNYLKVKGSYKLSGSCKNNKMDGPFSVSASYRWGYIKLNDEKISMKGSFLEGVPNGNFTASITDIGSVNVNYNKGILVGSYSVDASMLDNSLWAKIKGSFDKKGNMIGKWEFNTLNLGDGTMDFVNGVLINASMNHSNSFHEASDKEMEIAKQFASGKISEEDLLDNGYIIVLDSLRLGDYACDIFYRKRMVDWSNGLGYCSFKDSEWVKYKSLGRVATASEADLSTVLAECQTKGFSDLITFDKSINAYRINGKVLVKKQKEQILSAIDAYNRNNPVISFESFLDNYLTYHSFRQRKGNGVNAISAFADIQNQTNLDYAKKEYNALLALLDKIDNNESLQFDSVEKTQDGEYYIMKNNGNPFKCTYLPVSCVADFKALEDQIRQYEDVLPDNVAQKKELLRNQWDSIVVPALDRLAYMSDPSYLTDELYANWFGSSRQAITAEEFYYAVCPVASYDVKESDLDDRHIFEVSFTQTDTGAKLSVPVSFECVLDKDNLKIKSVSLPDEVLEGVRDELRKKRWINTITPSLDKLAQKSNLDSIASSFNDFFDDTWLSNSSQRINQMELLRTICPIMSYEINDNSNGGKYVFIISFIKQTDDGPLSVPVFYNCEIQEGDLVTKSITLPEETLATVRKIIERENKLELIKRDCDFSLAQLIGEGNRKDAKSYAPAKSRFINEEGEDTLSDEDFFKSIRPFIPIVGYEIKSVVYINPVDYDVQITVLLRSKGLLNEVTRQVVLKADQNGRIYVNSLDKKNAVKINE